MSTQETLLVTVISGILVYALTKIPRFFKGKLGFFKGLFEERKFPIVGRKRLMKMSNAFYLPTFNPEDESFDFIVYQLGIRPDIPLMDFMYHFYLKSLLKGGVTKKVVVVATSDLSNGEQHKYTVFKENTLKVYGELSSKVEFMDMDSKHVSGDSFISSEFNKAVQYIESKELISHWKAMVGSDNKTAVSELNKLAISIPGNIGNQSSDNSAAKSLLNLRSNNTLQNFLHHINRTWFICKNLDVNYFQQNKKEIGRCKVGFIFWEIEVAKLGVTRHFLTKGERNVDYEPILGRTVIDVSGKKPIPTHDPNMCVCVYSTTEATINNLKKHSKDLLLSHIGVLKIILNEAQISYSDEEYEEVGIRLINTCYLDMDSLQNNPAGDFCSNTKITLGMLSKLNLFTSLDYR